METKDMDIVRDVTHTLLVFLKKSGAGNPSPNRLWRLHGMKAAAKNINLVLIHRDEY
jgi:hypothetical protein